jgi:putative aldouronate transport system permease protein
VKSGEAGRKEKGNVKKQMRGEGRTAAVGVKREKRTVRKDIVKENLELYLMMAPVLLLIFLMAYLPLYGIVIAFQDFAPGSPILSPETEWVGWKYFEKFVTGKYFVRLFRNTLTLNLLNLIIGFPIPIIFALLLNEIKNLKYKKFAQTVSYMPYFISTVVVASIVLMLTGTDGLVNQIRGVFGHKPYEFNTSPSAFPWIYVITNVWKTFGWNSILYISNMNSIDSALYESAKLDGANRWHLARYITIPCLMPTIAVMLVLATGGLMVGNTDLILLLYNPGVYSTADVFGTYIYRDGLLQGNFSMSTAVGLIQSVVNFALVFFANKISNKISGNGLW